MSRLLAACVACLAATTLAWTPTRLHMSSASPVDIQKKASSLHPKVGDIVRYYELDGGQQLPRVGRLSFIQKNIVNDNKKQQLSSNDSDTNANIWTVEIIQLDDLGKGYYTDFSSRQRQSKKILRDLVNISPVAASWIRNENAWKVPISSSNIMVRADQYDIATFQGPFANANAINTSIVQADGLLYQALKTKLLRYAAIFGIAGTAVADLVKGPEDAIIYGAGSLASILYLFFLTLKTDTVGLAQAKFGNNLSNLRFVTPVLVIVGIALYNQSLGENNPVLLQQSSDNPSSTALFSTVTSEQFGAAILGFLSYRIPLFFTQIQDAFKDEKLVLPGSAGIALSVLQDSQQSQQQQDQQQSMAATTTVLLISGPQATGRSQLVQALVSSADQKLVTPNYIDRNQQGAEFERLEQRGEILYTDGRYALTKSGIVGSGNNKKDSVVVIDASVDLVKKLVTIAGLRLVGVWVGLNSVSEFEKRIGDSIDQGDISIPEDETRESVIRSKTKEIVKEIEYGITSGVFEFTILNKDPDESLKQLKEAASYCFK